MAIEPRDIVHIGIYEAPTFRRIRRFRIDGIAECEGYRCDPTAGRILCVPPFPKMVRGECLSLSVHNVTGTDGRRQDKTSHVTLIDQVSFSLYIARPTTLSALGFLKSLLISTVVLNIIPSSSSSEFLPYPCPLHSTFCPPSTVFSKLPKAIVSSKLFISSSLTFVLFKYPFPFPILLFSLKLLLSP